MDSTERPSKKRRAEDRDNEQTLIAPDAAGRRLDTSSWPLLLKNYDALNVRTGH
jgi:hypothetical protein